MSTLCNDNYEYIYFVEICVSFDRQNYSKRILSSVLFDYFHIITHHEINIINELLSRSIQNRTVLKYKRTQILDDLSTLFIKYDFIRDYRSRKTISLRYNL